MRQLRYPVRRALLLAALVTLVSAAARAAEPQNAEKEKQLIGVLQTAAAPEKAIACKQLAIHGSKAAVPELAKLLADEQLTSWARIALEAIPDPAADEALRGRLGSLKGRLAVGTINSIGVRRDAGAVDPLIARLKDPDADVASAAAVALGRIAGAAATGALRQSLAAAPAGVRSAVAEGCILCAERLMADGKDKEAAEIYDEVRRGGRAPAAKVRSHPRSDSGSQDRRHSAVDRAAQIAGQGHAARRSDCRPRIARPRSG